MLQSKILITIAISVLMIIFIISAILWNSTESFFPEDEAHYVHRSNPAVAVAECEYQGMTTILTCGGQSKV